MRHLTAPCLATAAAVLLTFPLQAQSYDDLAGGWVVRSWTLPNGTEVESPQPGLFVFTATGHYSITYVQGMEPRPSLPDDPSEAQRGAAFTPFTSNAGRYRIAGDRLTYEAFVAKNPGYMAAGTRTPVGTPRPSP